MNSEVGEVTQLLESMDGPADEKAERILPLVYAEMRDLARARLAAERPDHTLNPTALAHEAYLKLVGERDANWRNRAHFFALAARAMRRILIDHARGRNSLKRGGGLKVDELLVSVETMLASASARTPST